MTERPKPPKKKASKRRWLRRALGVAIGCVIGVGLLWFAVHRLPWLGPFIADGLRAVIGVKAVERIEAFAYGIQDRANRAVRSDEPPPPTWSAPPLVQSAPAVTGDAATEARPPFRPPSVKPMHEKSKTEVDGVWVPIPDPRRPKEPAVMVKTLLHPDASRPWAELFVVAFQLEHLRIELVPGTVEPRPNVKEARGMERPGLIPAAHHDHLVAAFNGGFKTEHGHYGLGIAGKTVVKARPMSCTAAAYPDGRLRIATHKKIAEDEAKWLWWRQAPPCVYEEDRMHPSLWDPETRGWGASSRRRGRDSPFATIGLNPERTILYVGVSNHTTARAMADGMHHAGASNVAQLDVNWSFPKIVLFEPGEGGALRTVSAFKGFVVDKKELTVTPSRRDFFYVRRRVEK